MTRPTADAGAQRGLELLADWIVQRQRQKKTGGTVSTPPVSTPPVSSSARALERGEPSTGARASGHPDKPAA